MGNLTQGDRQKSHGLPNIRSLRKMDIAIIYILISVTGGVIGQVLLKRGMIQLGEVTLGFSQLGDILLRMLTNPFVVIGLLFYVISSLFWLAALSRVELSFAYPFVSLSYIGMLFASWIFFQENLSALRLIGTGTIILGVILVARS
jgi:multidrug transporter EmrE-like cation transporter